MEKEKIQKEIIDYIKEKETISKLFTLESTLMDVYIHACKSKNIDEFKQWLEPKLKEIEKNKISYTECIINHPTNSVTTCLQECQVIP